MNLYQVAKEIAPTDQYLPEDEQGDGPSWITKFQADPYWKDYPLFYEYFHGDTGAVSARATRRAGQGALRGSCISLRRSEAGQTLEQGQQDGQRAGRGSPGEAMTRVLLSIALSDQHARLADGAVPRVGAASHARRYPGCRAGPSAQEGFDWVWFLSVWQTGSQPEGIPQNPGGAGIPERLCRICARRNRRLRFRHHRLPGMPDLGGDAALARLRERLNAARPASDARFYPEPYGPGSPLGLAATRSIMSPGRRKPATEPKNYVRVKRH